MWQLPHQCAGHGESLLIADMSLQALCSRLCCNRVAVIYAVAGLHALSQCSACLTLWRSWPDAACYGAPLVPWISHIQQDVLLHYVPHCQSAILLLLQVWKASQDSHFIQQSNGELLCCSAVVPKGREGCP